MTVIVTGSRGFVRRQTIERVLTALRPDELIEGGADGADKLARTIGLKLGIDVITVWANWTQHRRAAGPIRNSKMLALKPIDCVLAFPLADSVGTWDLVQKADLQRLQIHVYDEDGREIPREQWKIRPLQIKR